MNNQILNSLAIILIGIGAIIMSIAGMDLANQVDELETRIAILELNQ